MQQRSTIKNAQRVGTPLLNTTVLIALVGFTSAFAQTKDQSQPASATVSAPSPQLTAVEQRALQSILTDYQHVQEQAIELNKQMAAIENDIKKDHPGYQLDRGSMKLVPLPATPAAKPSSEQPPATPNKK